MKRTYFFIVMSCFVMNFAHAKNPYKKISDKIMQTRVDNEFQSFVKYHNYNYQRALFDAAARGYTDYIKPLLSLGASIHAVDYQNEQKTPLAYAAEYGHAFTCKRLLKLGAFVDVRSHNGFTPLMWAAEYGHKEVCLLLLKYGANVNARNDYGQNAAYYARYYGFHDLANMLDNYSVAALSSLEMLAASLALGVGVGIASLFS